MLAAQILLVSKGAPLCLEIPPPVRWYEIAFMVVAFGFLSCVALAPVVAIYVHLKKTIRRDRLRSQWLADGGGDDGGGGDGV